MSRDLSHDLARYITVLVEMTKFEGTRHGMKIAAQMLDVTIRVKDVRPFAVRQMVSGSLFDKSAVLSTIDVKIFTHYDWFTIHKFFMHCVIIDIEL